MIIIGQTIKLKSDMWHIYTWPGLLILNLFSSLNDSPQQRLFMDQNLHNTIKDSRLDVVALSWETTRVHWTATERPANHNPLPALNMQHNTLGNLFLFTKHSCAAPEKNCHSKRTTLIKCSRRTKRASTIHLLLSVSMPARCKNETLSMCFPTSVKSK